MRTIITAGIAALLIGTGLAAPANATPKNPVRGQFCAQADLGKTVKGLTCRYDGSKKVKGKVRKYYRWH